MYNFSHIVIKTCIKNGFIDYIRWLVYFFKGYIYNAFY